MDAKKVVGVVERVDFPELGLNDIPAKIDTGAFSIVIHTPQLREESLPDGTKLIHFKAGSGGREVSMRAYFRKRVRSSNGHVETRYFIHTDCILGGQTYRVVASLADRSTMTYEVLIGRRFLSEHGFVVDLSR